MQTVGPSVLKNENMYRHPQKALFKLSLEIETKEIL